MNDDLARARLLLVDDDLVMRSMAARTLRHAGFDVQDADSGEDALAQFEQHSHDLILLDVMMPGIDGYEVCQRVRAKARGARVPILMLTGLNDTESIELAYRHGATDFITKPINWTLLAHRVRYALRASIAVEEMRRSRESLARAQRLAEMGNWEIFPDRRMECSAQLAQLFGATVDALLRASPQEFLARVVAADRERVAAARAHLAQDGTPYQLEFQIERVDGTVRTVFEQATPILDDNAQRTGYEGITQDITERVQARERIQHLAHYDATTGLPNREFFSQLAGAAIERARRGGLKCALLYVDIDRFRSVNDAFGRARGDAVLQKLATRLKSLSRSSASSSVGRARMEPDLLARVGSNAFVLLVPDVASQESAAVVAQRLLEAVARPILIGSQSLVLTACLGVAFFPQDAENLPALIDCAEQAADAAKLAGRAQSRFFNEQMNARAASRLLMEADLRLAIEGNDLRLHFQPKVDAASGAIVGAEALVRWQHRERGLVPPGEFIALAEETGLILPLTDWVLEAACRSLRAWADAGLQQVPLSVNLAASSLADPMLVARLDGLMQLHGLARGSLMLEMTETMLMRDVGAGIALLEMLRAAGYQLSLDDFGTGYSSLSYLKCFPMDELKIDRTFITEAARGGRDGALAVAIITLGRELGLHVVAEGVETPEQSAFLLRHGCNVQQGYLFSRPVAANAFEQILREGGILPASIAQAVAAG